MKKLLFGLGAALLVANIAHAQDAPSSESAKALVRDSERARREGLASRLVQMVKTSPVPLKLEPVEGKPGVFTINPGTYVFKEMLESLATKTGGKAIFDDDFKATNIYLFVTYEGTIPELIEKLSQFNVAVGRIGQDWIFVKIKREFKNPPPIFGPSPTTPREAEPTEFRFNAFRGAKPVDPKKLPPGAKSWKFNGERVYYVPLPETQN